VHLAEARVEGHVDEGAVAVVAQQRVGMAPTVLQPGAAQHEDVQVAVVVVVRVHHVQAAVEPAKTGLGRAVGEGAVALVPEVAHLAAGVPGRGHDVQVAVVVHVVDDRAAAEVERVQPHLRSDVLEPREVDLRPERRRVHAEGLGHSLGIAAEGHGGDVDQPARGHPGRHTAVLVVEHRAEILDRLGGPLGSRVLAPRADRHDAALVGVARGTVLDLGEAQVGDAVPQVDVGRAARAHPLASEEGPRALEQGEALAEVAQAQLGPRRLEVLLDPGVGLEGLRGTGHLGAELTGAGRAQVGVMLGGLLGDPAQRV
jgi:hypothetical protein